MEAALEDLLYGEGLMDGRVKGLEEGWGGGGRVGEEGGGWRGIGDRVVEVEVCFVGWVCKVPVEGAVEKGSLDGRG